MSNAQVLLKGDAVAGAKYLAFAKAKLAALRGLGLTHVQRTFIVAEVEIQISIQPEGDRIYISATADSCPKINYNGFLDTFLSWAYYGAGEPPPALKAIQQMQEDTEPRFVDGVDVHKPMMYGMRKVPKYAPGTDPLPTMPPGYAVTGVYPKVSVARQTADDVFRYWFQLHPPTRYSGLMRRLLQNTFASSTWATALTYLIVGVRHFSFNYQFGDTWGLVLNPSKSGESGSDYAIIHIATAEVFYVPADICVHTSTVEGAVIHSPVLKSVNLAGAVSIGTFAGLGGSACSPAVGWAFSYTDPKASAVIYGTTTSGGMDYLTVSLATLSFTFDGVTGLPNEVALVQDAPVIFWCQPRTDKAAANPVGVFNTPNDDGTLTITLDVHNYPSTGPAGYDATNIPVHVYYLPGKVAPERVTYSYHSVAATSTALTAPTSMNDALSRPTNSVTNVTEGAYVNWGFSMNGAVLTAANGTYGGGPYDTYTRGSDETSFGIFGMTFGATGSATYTINYSYTITDTSTNPDTVYPYTQQLEAPRNLRGYDAVIHRNTITKSGGGVSKVSTCTLSADDREAVVIHDQRIVAALTETWTTTALLSRYYPAAGVTTAASSTTSYLETSGTYAVNPADQINIYLQIRHAQLVATWAPYPWIVVSALTFISASMSFGAQPTIGSYLTWPGAATGLKPSWSSGTAFGITYYQLAGTAYAAPAVGNADNSKAGVTEMVTEVRGAHDKITLDSTVWAAYLTPVYDLTDNWAVKHATAAYNPGYVRYDKLPMQVVVKMGSEEYTAEQALTGWLGAA